MVCLIIFLKFPQGMRLIKSPEEMCEKQMILFKLTPYTWPLCYILTAYLPIVGHWPPSQVFLCYPLVPDSLFWNVPLWWDKVRKWSIAILNCRQKALATFNLGFRWLEYRAAKRAYRKLRVSVRPARQMWRITGIYGVAGHYLENEDCTSIQGLGGN